MKRVEDREERLFISALMMPPAERDRFLALACNSEPLLHAHVIRLVESAESSASMFDESQMPARREGLERQIGPYSVIHEIGEGGCGVVYLAEQMLPVRRQVALKVIKLGMDTNDVIGRFSAERQALALMDHPGIAKVLDAGATPAGRPYFAMELVRGIKITDFCAQVRASVRDRIALFIQVCQALEHAHQKSIVHRDIKPSNVLVTLCDGTAIAKIIDFGIAKAMQGRLTEHTLHTALGQIVGTPEYISPEQTIPGSGHVDLRSDIYSLGVLLYELLTGNTPFGIASASRRAIDAVGSSLHAAEPLSPSTYLRELLRPRSRNPAFPRDDIAVQWMRQVRGDLDW
ncbi:MAG: serine/threonine-protein kinase, partial [Steroidobacter sp.]